MTDAADRIFVNAEVRTLGEPGWSNTDGDPADERGDEVHEAVAVRDGRIARVADEYEVRFLEGVGTDVVDCGGGVLLPGFVDAHTHMEILGRRLVHADLGGADDREAALERLREADDGGGWILGYGYDESTWPDGAYLTREDLDGVSADRPVVAFREDLHTASANSVVFERYGDELPASGVQRAGDGSGRGGDAGAGRPTGVVTEAAAEFLRMETAPDRAETRRLVVAARDRAHELGVTGVHDMVRNSEAPAAYRQLAVDGDLDLRVRLYYWADHLDALAETGLVTDHGGEYLEVGGVKTYTDGSLGARTAKLSEPYLDADEGSGDGADTAAGGTGSARSGDDEPADDGDGSATGEWIVDPDELAEIVERVEGLDMQLAVHAIGDEAIEVTLEALPDDAAARHRVEHAELLPADLSGFDAVASMQPNFLRWARPGGLYERCLGTERTAASNRFADVLEAGIPLAFGSDCMPLDPLYGVQQTVTAPEPEQRLSVTEALRAYTVGAAHAGRAEDRFGTLEPGSCADLVVLEESPWTVADEEIADVDVSMTVVGGDVVYRT